MIKLFGPKSSYRFDNKNRRVENNGCCDWFPIVGHAKSSSMFDGM